MNHPKRALLSWSSGKDSAFALHVLRQRHDIELVGLLTTVSEPYARVAMHGVRLELLRAQADAAGLPMWEVPLPSRATTPSTRPGWAQCSPGREMKASAHKVFDDWTTSSTAPD